MIATNSPTLQLPAAIFQQAMNSAREGITIADAREPDLPLIYVNQGFLSMTGYTADEVLGRNCRFLQGKDDDQANARLIRQALTEGRYIRTTLLNYRKSGEPFWNRLSINPVMNEKGVLTHFIGIQDDITVEKMKLELDRKNLEQELMIKVSFETQERERQALGHELHDNINPMLVAANLYLSASVEQTNKTFALIGEAKNIINNTVQEIRKLSQTLVGPALPEASLGDAVISLIRRLQTAAPFELNLYLDEVDEARICKDCQLMFYRILQEQLNNVIKHAAATIVTVRFWVEEERQLLSVKDNGLGFDASAQSQGVGLRSIQYRLQLVGGTMELHTSPGNGCELIVAVPLG